MASFSFLGEKLLNGKVEGSTSDLLKDKEVVGVYFSAHWCGPCRGFTPKLAEAYNGLKEDGKSFEIVFVSSDRDQGSFDEYYAEQPWLALPFSERDLKGELSAKYGVRGIPTLVLLNSEGEIITKNGRAKIMGAPKDFPWKPRSLEELIGKSLLRGAEDDDDEAATEKVDSSCLDGKVLGIYFSAHWCPPCRGFTPVLIEKYNALKKAGKNIEIVFASSDRDNASFVEYFAEMPWLALPYENRSEKEGLSEMFEVGGIPTLVFLDENRKIITKNGRGGISSSTFIEDFPYYPKPLNDLSNDMDGIDENPSLLVLMEKAEKSEQDTVEKAFQPVAEKEFKTKEKRVYCFTAKGGGPIEQIRQMCKLQDATKKPVMVILDIQKQSFHLPCAGSEDVTEPNLAKFIEDFRAKKTLGVSF